jgi:hypothetical protein
LTSSPRLSNPASRNSGSSKSDERRNIDRSLLPIERRFVGFKRGDDGIEFLDIPTSSGFQFSRYIDLIAELTRARAKFPEVAYRGCSSFFAPSNLFIKGAHGYLGFVMSAANQVCPRDTVWRPRQHHPKSKALKIDTRCPRILIDSWIFGGIVIFSSERFAGGRNCRSPMLASL